MTDEKDKKIIRQQWEIDKLREALVKITTQTDQLIVDTIARRALIGDFV